MIGTADAGAIRAIGEATAEAMKIRAVAMQDYGREALVQMIQNGKSKVGQIVFLFLLISPIFTVFIREFTRISG